MFFAIRKSAHILLLNGLLLTTSLWSQTPSFNASAVVNGARFTPAMAAGSPATIFGSNLGPGAPVFSDRPPLLTTLGGTTVRVNGAAAPLYFVSANQINFQMPWEVAGQPAVSVSVSTNGGTSSPVTVALAPLAPALFVLSQDGKLGPGWVWRGNYSILSASNPARRGDAIGIMGIGMGPVTNQPASGAANPVNPLATTINQPSVSIGGVPATSVSGLLSPVDRSGFYEIRAVVPDNAPAGGAIPLTVSIGGVTSNIVTIPISSASAPELSLSPASLTLTAPAGSPALRRSVQITNSGGGTLNWSASVAAGAPWLAISPAQGTATLAGPAALNLTVNFAQLTPGVYQTSITVRDNASGASLALPVSIAASGPPASLELSQSTLSFTVVQGSLAPPAQTLRISNAGSGGMAWTIAPGASQGFTAPVPASGIAMAGSAGSEVAISVNPAGLSPGTYQTVYQVSAAGAANSPLSVVAVLQVLPSAAPANLTVSPAGLVFTASQINAPVPAQRMRIGNSGGGTVQFSVVPVANTNALPWLSASLLSGSISSGEVEIQISVNTAGFPPGVYRGAVTVTPTQGPPQSVDVAMVIPASPVNLQRELPGAALCTPSGMDLIPTVLGNGVVLPVSYPRTLSVYVFDNCGSAVSDATVVANIAGVMHRMNSSGSGQYSGTVTADRELAGVLISFLASSETLGSVVRHIVVSSATAAQSLPVLQPNGVVEAAGFAPQRPLAPGSIVSIFGSQLAAADNFATELPLPRSLGGVGVRIGRDDVPLFYAGPGQINAQIPFSAQPGETVQVLANVNGRFSAPHSYLIAPNQPGIFQSGGVVAALDSQFRHITSDNPARIGDVVQIFTTGLGLLNESVGTGERAPNFSTVRLPVTAEIGGVQAPVVYQGLAPGFVGLYQVNVHLTAAVPTGDEVPVVLRQNGIASNPTLPVSLPIR